MVKAEFRPEQWQAKLLSLTENKALAVLKMIKIHYIRQVSLNRRKISRRKEIEPSGI